MSSPQKRAFSATALVALLLVTGLYVLEIDLVHDSEIPVEAETPGTTQNSQAASSIVETPRAVEHRLAVQSVNDTTSSVTRPLRSPASLHLRSDLGLPLRFVEYRSVDGGRWARLSDVTDSRYLVPSAGLPFEVRAAGHRTALAATGVQELVLEADLVVRLDLSSLSSCSLESATFLPTLRGNGDLESRILAAHVLHSDAGQLTLAMSRDSCRAILGPPERAELLIRLQCGWDVWLDWKLEREHRIPLDLTLFVPENERATASLGFELVTPSPKEATSVRASLSFLEETADADGGARTLDRSPIPLSDWGIATVTRSSRSDIGQSESESWEFPNLPINSRIRVRFEDPHGKLYGSWTGWVHESATVPVRLERAPIVRGRLVSDDGSPIRRAEISLEFDGRFGEEWARLWKQAFSLTCDEMGAFEFGTVRSVPISLLAPEHLPTTATVTITAPGHVPHVADVDTSSPIVDLGRIALAPDSSRIVVFGTDEPLHCSPYLMLFDRTVGTPGRREAVVESTTWREGVLEVALERRESAAEVDSETWPSSALLLCDSGAGLGCRRSGDGEWAAVTGREVAVSVRFESATFVGEVATLTWNWNGMSAIAERGVLGEEPGWLDRTLIVPRDDVRWQVWIGEGEGRRLYAEQESAEIVEFGF